MIANHTTAITPRSRHTPTTPTGTIQMRRLRNAAADSSVVRRSNGSEPVIFSSPSGTVVASVFTTFGLAEALPFEAFSAAVLDLSDLSAAVLDFAPFSTTVLDFAILPGRIMAPVSFEGAAALRATTDNASAIAVAFG